MALKLVNELGTFAPARDVFGNPEKIDPNSVSGRIKAEAEQRAKVFERANKHLTEPKRLAVTAHVLDVLTGNTDGEKKGSLVTRYLAARALSKVVDYSNNGSQLSFAPVELDAKTAPSGVRVASHDGAQNTLWRDAHIAAERRHAGSIKDEAGAHADNYIQAKRALAFTTLRTIVTLNGAELGAELPERAPARINPPAEALAPVPIAEPFAPAFDPSLVPQAA